MVLLSTSFPALKKVFKKVFQWLIIYTWRHFGLTIWKYFPIIREGMYFAMRFRSLPFFSNFLSLKMAVDQIY